MLYLSNLNQIVPLMRKKYKEKNLKTKLVFVTTLDGKVTKWGDPHVFSWSSQEDQTHFKKIWAEAKTIIMGSSTYNFDPIKPSPDQLLIVLTSTPEKYQSSAIKNQLEFSSETPKQIYNRLQKSGTDELLIVGGPHIATAFLKDRLIDELFLTMEPKIFGSGGNFVIGIKLDISLKLISHEQINNQGTLVMRYEVVK